MEFENIKLSKQLCFPLYACSKEIIRKYTPYLEKIGLTYTQYIVMMVMWEHEELTVNELGKYLYLDSGTLSPLIKKLEEKEYLVKKRNKDDERIVNIEITEKGKELKSYALKIYDNMSNCINLSKEESLQLYKLLYKILGELNR